MVVVGIDRYFINGFKTSNLSWWYMCTRQYDVYKLDYIFYLNIKTPITYNNGYHFNPLRETHIIDKKIDNRSWVSFKPTSGDNQIQGYPSKTMVILKF